MSLLENKVAIVTGAGQGVGRGIALALAAEGARVMLMGRTEAKLLAVGQEFAGRGATAATVVGDVKSRAEIERCVQATVDAFGGIDILVNNAQEVALGHLLELDDDAVNAGWESGPLAALRFMRACHPYLKAHDGKPGGVIINVASGAGVRPDPVRRGAYAAVKEAMRAFTSAAAVEWGRDGIRVNAILPYATSPALEQLAREYPEEYEARLGQVPLGRIGDPELDVGRGVVMLVSDHGSYVTGATIPLEGGISFVG